MLRLMMVTLLAASAFAADKKPARQFTQEETRDAYQMSIKQITKMLKAPWTAHFALIEDEEVNFSPGRAGHRNDIVVRLYVDSQNIPSKNNES